MNIIFFDTQTRLNLYPLNLAKPNACLRIGGLTFKERWQKLLPNATFSFLTEVYLSKKFPLTQSKQNIFINPLFFPNQDYLLAIKNLNPQEGIYNNSTLVAYAGSIEGFKNKNIEKKKSIDSSLLHLEYPWHFFQYNEEAINYDFELITKNKKSVPIPNNIQFTGNKNNIFIEENAQIEHCYINATNGKIYIGNNAHIMDGVMIRNSLFLAKNSVLKLGAKIYGATTIGPYCKVGGEINNSILMQYSNKAHDGFLGNSVIGEWCNLGADTNNSNLKNNYGKVECWSIIHNKYNNTNLQFCGLIMGDHTKSAINTQFNTGTIAGFSSNIFTTGFPPKHIPSFSFGGGKKSLILNVEKAIEVAKMVMKRRQITFTEADKIIFNHIFNIK